MYKKPHRSDCIVCYIVIDLKLNTNSLHYVNKSDFKKKMSLRENRLNPQFRIILGTFKENSRIAKKYKKLVRSQSRANIKDRFIIDYYQGSDKIASVPMKTMRSISVHLGLGLTQTYKYVNKPYVKNGVSIIIRKVML